MSISEFLGTTHDGGVQVCATADAEYDGAVERVIVKLNAFTRRASAVHNGARQLQPWLPDAVCLSEHLPREDADKFVTDVFSNWVKKVRAAVPPDRPLRP